VRVGVFMGGKSREREISLRSGQKVIKALKNRGYEVVAIDPASTKLPWLVDVAYLVTHGRYGEDGCLQGLLEIFGIPYTGSGVLASALAMDKRMMKQIFSARQIATPDWGDQLTPPLVIKPAREGSSIGVTRVKTKIAPAKLQQIIQQTKQEFGEILIERLIVGREVTVGVLDQTALPILELVPNADFYDYTAKYTPGATKFLVPAPLPEQVTEKLQALALKAHRSLGCTGVSRVDILLDAQLNGYVIDVNTLPGMTAQSDLPAAAQAAGIEFDELVERILLLALAGKK
jgi:D-alanine-D-alanine ligase